MQLEVISKFPEAAVRSTPILLVHGAWHGAWCWQNNFLEYFAEHGWQTHAMSLRGHGNSEGKSGIRKWSINDYVEDVCQVVDSLEDDPIIIGHSMGGFVTQKYLEKHPARAAVLLASAPPFGTLKFNRTVLRRHPLIWLMSNASMSTYPMVKNRRHVREWFLSEDASDEVLDAYHAQLQDESYRASWDMLALNRVKTEPIKTPIAVLGAQNDIVFTAEEVEATARVYNTEATIFPSMTHSMMMNSNWKDVADWVARWCESVM